MIAHIFCDLFGALQPQVNQLFVAGFLEDDTGLELILDLSGLGLVTGKDCTLVRRCLNVREGNGDARPSRPVETSGLECIKAVSNQNIRVTLGQGVDDLAQLLLADNFVNEGVVDRELLVEDRAAQRGFQNDVVAFTPALGCFPIQRRNNTREADTCALVQVKITVVEGHACFSNR